jgi:hypothetical protein
MRFSICPSGSISLRYTRNKRASQTTLRPDPINQCPLHWEKRTVLLCLIPRVWQAHLSTAFGGAVLKPTVPRKVRCHLKSRDILRPARALVLKPVVGRVGHPANQFKPRLNHADSRMISNWHYWRILMQSSLASPPALDVPRFRCEGGGAWRKTNARQRQARCSLTY